MTLQDAIMLVLQASIMLMVFGFGLQAAPADVLHALRQPSLLARSLAAMFVIMPIVAVAIVRLFGLHPVVAIALVALSISPVPPLLPAREAQAGGHQGYGLGLLAIAGLVSIATVPIALALLGRYFSHPYVASSVQIAKVVLMLAVVPLAAGLAFRAWWPAVAARVAKPAGLLSHLLLGIGALAILVRTLPAVWALVGNGSVAAMAAFVAVGLAVGHWLGGPKPENRTVLALSTASRHPAIALAIAKANFPAEPQLGAAIALFLLVNFVIAFPYLMRQKRRVGARVSHDRAA